MYDDENYDDGFDEEKLAARFNVDLWKKLFAYAREYPKILRWLATFAFLTALMEVAYPLITKGVIDEVDVYLKGGADPSFWLWGFLYFACTVVITLAIGGFIWNAGRLRTHIAHDIRKDGFANLQRLSFNFYDYRPVGWLMARMTSDSERLSNILAWGFLDLIWGFTMMIGIAIAMFVMNWKLALVVFSVMPFLGWISAKFQQRILKSARQVRATNSRITGNFNEAIMGVLTSKAFVREDANQTDFKVLTDRMHTASVTNLTHAAVYLPIVITMASLATGLALAVGGMDMIYGIIPVSTLIAFMAYTRHFFDPIEQLGHWFAEMQMAQASAERILSLIEAEPAIKDSPEVLEAMQIQARRTDASSRYAADGGEAAISMIEVQNLKFAYDASHPVIDNINLTIRKGETVAVVGPTGGGKSTLVNIICRFYEPTGGQILIDGVDYRARSLHWLQSNVGMVLQNAHVFSGSIMENIRYGRLDATDEEVIEAARTAGAHEFIEAFPSGYETNPGESGGRLSAGQKQLVSFARAILADPQILVMDEATSSVDTETEQRIQAGLQQVLKGRLALVIAHRLSTIRNANRIIVVAAGNITESGTHDELMQARGAYYELYRQQSLQEASGNLGDPVLA
ncbi:MAG: ATP-binding cassette domain-containing protein [Pseudomonadales bacterium]|nr:ATP-binding cassette domain-containing protein [Pseudomonadales bacterium]